MNLGFGFACYFSTNYYYYVVFRFFIGIASNLCYIGQFVMTLEVIGARYRSELGILILFWFDMGVASLSLFGYYISLGYVISSLAYMYIFLRQVQTSCVFTRLEDTSTGHFVYVNSHNCLHVFGRRKSTLHRVRKVQFHEKSNSRILTHLGKIVCLDFSSRTLWI